MLKKSLFKVLIVSLAGLIILIGLSLWFYLAGLKELIKSDFVINNLKNITAKNFNIDLEISNPNLQTYLKPTIDFKIDNLTLKKNNVVLIELNNFDSSVSFNKIFQKEIRLNKLKAETINLKLDKLLDAFEIEQKEDENFKFDYKIDFYKADIGLDEFNLSYYLNKTLFDICIKDIALVYENDYKNLDFNLMLNVIKDNKTYLEIISSTLDEIRLYDDRLEVNDLKVLVNKSDLKLNSKINKKGIFLNAKSDRFYLRDVFEIINADVVIPNGESMLSPLNNPKGFVDFDINCNNNNLNGYININKTGANLKDISNIPLEITKGQILITKDKIIFNELKGYYGKNKNNTLNIRGDIKDYYKTFDSNIIIDTLITNEFFKDYLSKLINNTVLYVSKPAKTLIIYKAKNNIMDITWLSKIPKGVNFGINEEKSALSDYDRAVKGDFHIEGNQIDIKNINYYIASDIKRGIKLTPVIIMDAKTDFTGKIYEAGFSFGKKMPCEFLNIFLGHNFFKRGEIEGRLHILFNEKNIPYLNSDMTIEKTFIPSQRLFIRNAKLKTNKDIINFDLNGRFKRVKYIFKGKMKNELNPPFVIKDMALNLDNINVEKFLKSVNNQNIDNSSVDENITSEDELADDDYMFDTNLIRIENADFTLDKGNYKELMFSDIKAKLTLDEKGILKINSNKFNIANGISTLKVECDLKNLKHYVRLGVKDIDSNLMAKVLFNLDKEITGLASGLIELNTDKTLKLNGNIKFLVNEGTIGKIGLVEYVLKIASVFRNPIAMISPSAIMDIVSVPEGKFDKITGEIKIKNNVLQMINIKSYSKSLSALIRGRFDIEKHDASIRIYTRFSSDKKSVFGFLRNFSLNALANKVKLNTRNDANYYESELRDLPQIEADESHSQVFLTQVEGDIENFNFISSLKKIK